MKYNVQQFLNILIFFFGLYTLGVNFSSCRKADFHNSKLLVDRDRFFAIPDNSPQVLKRIVSNLKLQEERKPFVENFIKNQGYPNWEYSQINISEHNNNSFLPDNDTLVSVPIIKDQKEYVKSVLAIKVNQDIWYKLLDGIKYGELPIEKPIATGQVFTALDFLNLMMEMEAKIFGRNEFIITDTAVLPRAYIVGAPEPYYGVQIHFVNGCTVFNYGNYVKNKFEILSTETLCLYETGELVYTLEPPDIGVGGGGGSGRSGPTNYECHRGFAGIHGFDENGNPMTACPDMQENQTPCDVAQNAAKKMDTLFTKSKIDSMLTILPANWQADSIEYGFPIYKKYVGDPLQLGQIHITGYYPGAVHTDNTVGAVTINFDIPYLTAAAGSLHIHPNGGYTAQSALDIYSLIQTHLENDNQNIDKQYEGNFVVAFNGSQYAINVTDTIKAAAFYQTKNIFLSGNTWNENSAIGIAFSKARDYFENKYADNSSRDNLAYEMAMSAVLNQFNSGISFCKKDAATGNFKPIVINTTTPNLNKPNRKVYVQDCI